MFEVIYELIQWTLAGWFAFKLWKLRGDCAGGFGGVWQAIGEVRTSCHAAHGRIETAFHDIRFCARKHNEVVEAVERLNTAVFNNPKSTNEDPHLIITYGNGVVENRSHVAVQS